MDRLIPQKNKHLDDILKLSAIFNDEMQTFKEKQKEIFQSSVSKIETKKINSLKEQIWKTNIR